MDLQTWKPVFLKEGRMLHSIRTWGNHPIFFVKVNQKMTMTDKEIDR